MSDQGITFSCISRDSIQVPRHLVAALTSRISFDNGATLCKILYVTDADAASSCCELNFLTVCRADFPAAIRWIKSHRPDCRLSSDGSEVAKMTGVNFGHQDLFRETLNASCEHVIEILTLVRGCHWMVTHLTEEQAFLPVLEPEPLYKMDVKNELLANMANMFKIEGSGDASKMFPAVLACLGSSCMILSLDADGKMAGFHFAMLAGKNLQGMAQLMLGTADYNEIMSLAEKGDRGNVDLLFKEVIAEDPNSPYGQLKGDIPMMHFGKAAEGRVTQGAARREDMARSLVSLVCMNLLSALMSVCTLTQVPRVYFGGNFFQHRLARQEFENGKAIFATMQPGGGGFQHRFLRNGGHVGAAGALVATNMDAPAFLKFG